MTCWGQVPWEVPHTHQSGQDGSRSHSPRTVQGVVTGQWQPWGPAWRQRAGWAGGATDGAPAKGPAGGDASWLGLFLCLPFTTAFRLHLGNHLLLSAVSSLHSWRDEHPERSGGEALSGSAQLLCAGGGRGRLFNVRRTLSPGRNRSFRTHPGPVRPAPWPGGRWMPDSPAGGSRPGLLRMGRGELGSPSGRHARGWSAPPRCAPPPSPQARGQACRLRVTVWKPRPCRRAASLRPGAGRGQSRPNPPPTCPPLPPSVTLLGAQEAAAVRTAESSLLQPRACPAGRVTPCGDSPLPLRTPGTPSREATEAHGQPDSTSPKCARRQSSQ